MLHDDIVMTIAVYVAKSFDDPRRIRRAYDSSVARHSVAEIPRHNPSALCVSPDQLGRSVTRDVRQASDHPACCHLSRPARNEFGDALIEQDPSVTVSRVANDQIRQAVTIQIADGLDRSCDTMNAEALTSGEGRTIQKPDTKLPCRSI